MLPTEQPPPLSFAHRPLMLFVYQCLLEFRISFSLHSVSSLVTELRVNADTATLFRG